MRNFSIIDITTRAILFFVLLMFIGLLSRMDLRGDFMGYWAGSALIFRGENPYDAETIHQLQLSTGRGESYAVRVWNPPWTNVILLPFGILPFAWGRAFWLVVSILLLAISGHWLAQIYWPERGKMSNLMAVILPLLFAHTWNALIQGQINLLVLFSLAGAMFFFSKHPALSGGLLILATVKPQLSIGAGAVLGIQALYERRWGFIGGAVGTLTGLLLVLTLLRPSWWQDYQTVLRTPLLDYRTPTVATWLREQFPGLPIPQLMFFLAVISLLALLGWTVKTKQWNPGVAAAVIITLLFNLFNWSYDQIVLLLPAYLLWGYVQNNQLGRRLVGTFFFIFNLLILYVRFTNRDDFDFVWVVPVFALFYLTMLILFRQKYRE